MADATDGHHRFGTVNIVNNSGSSEEAEVWVFLSNGTPVGTYGKFGKKGQHILLPGLFIQVLADVQAYWDSLNAYTVAHEFGHHAYGLVDEYADGSGHSGPNISCAPPPADVCNRDLDYCLMDGFGQRGGGGCPHPDRPITMNEFCVASNHDKANSSGFGGGETAQSVFNHRSCWETISRLKKAWKIPAPTQAVSAPPAAQAVTFGTSCGTPKVAIVIDRSGSMTLDNRLSFAKLGTEQFINAFANGSLAVVSFSNSASVNFTLTEINNDTTRNNAKAAVNALAAGGPTNIGDGLLAALAQLNSQGGCSSCEKTIILLSDGEHNVGTPPEAVVSQLNDSGVKLITSVVGSSISLLGESSLQTITSQANGEYYRVSTASDATGQSFPGYGSSGLVGLFMRLGSDMKGDALLKQEQHVLTSGQVKQIPVLVETRAQTVSFAATLADQTDNVTLSLRSPSGVTYTGSISPSVVFSSSPNSRSFRVDTPEQGTWTTVVSAGTIKTGKVEVLSFAKHDGVRLDASVSEQTVTAAENVQVYATPTFEGERVVGASVTGVAGRPDGSKMSISLFDDGLDTHGDIAANDGIYSAVFNSYTAAGTYVFELTAQNSTGRAYAGEPLSPDLPSNDKPIPTFVRSANTTATVSGMGITAGEAVWFDDVSAEGPILHGDADGGASGSGEGDGWYWVKANPAPLSGMLAHQSTRRIGFHQHYFEGASPLMLSTGDKLFTYIFLDNNNLPDEIMLQWHDGNNWEHRAYWGQNRIGFGAAGTDSRRYIGPLPVAGRWVRLDVPASLVGLEGSSVTGMAFSLYGGRATWDHSGRLLPDVPVPSPSPGDFVWVEDDVPAGAIQEVVDDQWLWLPPHFSGTQGHRSFLTDHPRDVGKFRAHSFRNASTTMNVQPGDALFTYVYLDGSENGRKMPEEIVLQWYDGSSWEHRAYWGLNYLGSGTLGTETDRFMGGIPPGERWVRLEVPASYVGLEGKSVSGMSFGFYDTSDYAGINWDYSGKSSRANTIPLPLSATTAVWQYANGTSGGVVYNTSDFGGSPIKRFYAHPNQAAATVPFYRFRKADTSDPQRFYSRSSSIPNWLLDDGPADKGIPFYVYPDASTPGTVPLYLYHDNQFRYFLTTDLNEANSQHFDGIWAYVFAPNPAVPAAPSFLGYNNVYLSWEDNSANETGFAIEFFDSTHGGQELWTQLKTVDANVTLSKVSSVPSRYYRVRAFNVFGNSGYSNIACYECNMLDSNTPPLVQITTPANGDVVASSFAIAANVFDEDGPGTIAKAEFFADGNKLGEVTTPPYSFVWNNAAPGNHVLTAKATDTAGAATTSSGVSITVSQNPPIFFDDFNDNSLDVTKWTVVAPTSPAVVNEQTQQLRITLQPNTAAYNGLFSNATYDMRGKTVQVEVAQTVSQGGWSENYVQVMLDAQNYYLIDVGSGSMLFRSMVNGVNDQSVISYDPTALPYWRIRHDQTADTVSFETSTNGVNWTTRKTVAAGFSLTAVRFYLMAGAWGTGNGSPGAAKYDNFQLAESGAAPVTNVALNKPATQVSTYSTAVAGLAVDGNTDGAFWNGSVTHTATGAHDWWQLDLGSSYSLATVKVWNRTDCCGDRLATFYVFVSDQPFTSYDLNANLNQSGVSNYYIAGQGGTPSDVSVNRTGRYVRVQLSTNGIPLSLAEVQVMGSPHP